jgi:dihydrofolate reductase
MTLPPLTLVAAVGQNRVIGRAGQIPWDLPEDRAHFRKVTMGHAIIMGRRTWDETGAALPGRRNIVVSRSGDVSAGDREVYSTLAEAIAAARQTDAEPMVIGGAEIFRLALPVATRLVLTEVALSPPGDTFFPDFDRSAWRETDRRPGDRASYVFYERSDSAGSTT